MRCNGGLWELSPFSPGALTLRGNMMSGTHAEPEGGRPGGRRTSEKEAVSLVKHCSLLSKMRLGHQWWYWTVRRPLMSLAGTLSVQPLGFESKK